MSEIVAPVATNDDCASIEPFGLITQTIKMKIEIDRKVLADLAENNKKVLAGIVEKVSNK